MDRITARLSPECIVRKVIGPDISFYQDNPATPQGIDFVKMREFANFIIIRAGQNLWPDSSFKSSWKAAKAARFPRGSYWFYDSRADPKQQADLWVELIKEDPGELPLFADIEERYNGPFRGPHHWQVFLERLKAQVGKKEIGIYTAYYYWTENSPVSGSNSGSLEYFHQFPLWIANYGVNQPMIPKPWDKGEWLFWQFSNSGNGKAYGVESESIDLNYFNGNFEEFCRRFPDPRGTPPKSSPAPEPGTGTQYRVSAASLRVRTGPGTNYEIIGYLQLNEIVQELVANDERTWIQIRRQEGLTGWCSAGYLVPVENPPSPGSESPDQEYWYRVKVSSLAVREKPRSDSKILGNLHKDDTVPVTGDATDDGWVQIGRLDGLRGWCPRSFLSDLGVTRPETLQQVFFKGVMYYRRTLSEPRPTAVHILTLDLLASAFEFLVTPAGNQEGILCARTTSKFLSRNNLSIAINGDGFSYVDPSSIDPAEYCRDGSDPVRPNGFAASRGTVYSRRPGPTLYISQQNEITFERKNKIYNAISGDSLVVIEGRPVKDLVTNNPNPVTAIGLSEDGTLLTLLVVDGRQPGTSEGVTSPELADLLVSLGVHTGINMDGGGSSTMVVRGMDGKAHILNVPIDEHIPGRERAVANHLGIFVK